jgi:hypothetical protein
MALRIALIGTGLAVALVALPALAADVVINEEARAHFTAGVNLLQDPDGARYEEAYREFKAAYAASPSWKILGNLGISAMKLERDGEAIEAYRKYLTEGGKQVEADERAQFQRDLATLESGVVRLTLDSEPPGALIEDERFPTTGNAIRNAYTTNGPLQIGVRAGRHRFTAKLAGRPDAVWEVELSPRQQQSYVFKFGQPSSAATAAAPATGAPAGSQPGALSVDSGAGSGSNGMRIGSYVAFGVGVVGLGAGTLFAMQAKGNYQDANDITTRECGAGNGDCELGDAYPAWKSASDDGDSAKTLSLVGFIVGGVGVATGVTLFVLSSGKKEEPAAAKVEPYLGVGALGVRGSF